MDYFNIQGKIALITGASSGLGVHFANVLAKEGATVVLAARRAEKLEAEAENIKRFGGDAHNIILDVTDPVSVEKAFKTINDKFGKLDILVNNAGVASDPIKFLNTGEEDWRWTMDVNLDGVWRVARAASRLMVDVGAGGSIINVASIYGIHTGALKVAYNVSKTAVNQLSKSMAIELCRHDIRVNSLCPGWFKTELNQSYFESEGGKKYVQKIPAKRLGNLEDLTVPLLLLASNTAGAYVTGTSVVVDGGITETPV